MQDRFRSQVTIGPFRADFAFPREKVVIEADGIAFHGSIFQKIRDTRRDIYLSGQGWKVVRFTQAAIESSANHCATLAEEIVLSRRQRIESTAARQPLRSKFSAFWYEHFRRHGSRSFPK